MREQLAGSKTLVQTTIFILAAKHSSCATSSDMAPRRKKSKSQRSNASQPIMIETQDKGGATSHCATSAIETSTPASTEGGSLDNLTGGIGLLGIAPELRNHIYSYVVASQDGISNAQPALFATCRQIRNEGLGLFYTDHISVFNHDTAPNEVVAWTSAIGEAHASREKHFRIICSHHGGNNPAKLTTVFNTNLKHGVAAGTSLYPKLKHQQLTMYPYIEGRIKSKLQAADDGYARRFRGQMGPAMRRLRALAYLSPDFLVASVQGWWRDRPA